MFTNQPRSERGPLRTLFLLTTMPVGGAETLLVELIRRLDRTRITPEIACLKDLDELGHLMSKEVKTSSNYLSNKYDLRVLPRLTAHFAKNQVDAVVIVGAGDKMFWGRLAGLLARTPVVVSALHSTGWPDGVSFLNRLLTPITDGFIAVAKEHGRFLSNEGGLPPHKVHVIPNGVDTERFQHDSETGSAIREELRISPTAPVCGIVAALRPEKNHEMFLAGAQRIRQQHSDARFIIIGDGPERGKLEKLSQVLRINDAVDFLGTRSDIPALLASMNCMMLTSKMEANPVSILEALSTEVPVVATRVGSVPTTVIDDETGFLVEPGNADDLAEKVNRVLSDVDNAKRLGRNGRSLVQQDWSVEAMVQGYESLIESIYDSKAKPPSRTQPASPRNKNEVPREEKELVSL